MTGRRSAPSTRRVTPRTAHPGWSSAHAGRFMNSCRSARFPQEAGRVYRKIEYGPLLDVFLIDMRSYRDSTWNRRDDRSDTFILGAVQLAWLKRELAASRATWKV